MVIIVITAIAMYHLSGIYELLGAGPGGLEWRSLNPAEQMRQVLGFPFSNVQG